MRAVIWVPGEGLGELSADRVSEIRGESSGPLVAVIDDADRVMIIQPIDPETGADWESEVDALAFAHRYMAPVSEILEKQVD